MRFVVPLLIAATLLFLVLWGGAKIAHMVDPPHARYTDFTVGRKMDLCGYAVDVRHVAGGYDLRRWRGGRCEALSDLDRCILSCLERAGTVKIGANCYAECFDD